MASVALREVGTNHPWSQVTDDKGCIGITWIVRANVKSVSLAIESPGFEAGHVDVPTMKEDACYSVRLSRGSSPSTVSPTDAGKCQCAMFSGKNVWRDK